MRLQSIPVLLCLAAGWIYFFICPVQTMESAAQTRFTVDVNLVTLRFTVRDETGGYVNSLDAGDFSVSENGRNQEISIFEKPRSMEQTSGTTWLAFLLDVSGSTLATRREEILAARSFFENIQDSVMVGVFGFTDELMVFQNFTDNSRRVLDAFSAADRHKGKTAIYRASSKLLSEMNRRAQPGDRKIIIVLSDGMDDEFRRSAATVALAKESSAVFYTVWVPSAAFMYSGPAANDSEKVREDRQRKQEAYAALSVSTRGRHFGGFEAILDFDDVMAHINDEVFGNLYTVGYYSDLDGLGKRDRDIHMTFSGKGKEPYRIRGIYQNLPDLVQSKKQFIEALFDSGATQSLTGRIAGFRDFGAEVDVRKATFDGEMASVPFRLKISPFTIPLDSEGKIDTQFGYVGLLSDTEGGEVLRLRGVFSVKLTRDQIMNDGRGILYNGTFRVPPGRYFFRMAVLRIPSWDMTVVDKILQISGPAKGY
ncbi:MAG: VWA domain-containing protein [Acidobacteriota bacterium]